MDKRIEMAPPVLDSELRASRILGIWMASLDDTAKLRELMPDGSYTPLGAFAKEDADGETVLFESQEFFIKRAQQRRLEAAEDEAARDAARRRSAQLMAAHEMTEDEASIRAEERAAAGGRAHEAERLREAATRHPWPHRPGSRPQLRFAIPVYRHRPGIRKPTPSNRLSASARAPSRAWWQPRPQRAVRRSRACSCAFLRPVRAIRARSSS